MSRLRGRVDRLERGSGDDGRLFVWADTPEELSQAPTQSVVAHYDWPEFAEVRRTDVLEVVLPEKVSEEDVVEQGSPAFMDALWLMRDKDATPIERVKAAHRLSSCKNYTMRQLVEVELSKRNPTYEETLRAILKRREEQSRRRESTRDVREE